MYMNMVSPDLQVYQLLPQALARYLSKELALTCYLDKGWAPTTDRSRCVIYLACIAKLKVDTERYLSLSLTSAYSTTSFSGRHDHHRTLGYSAEFLDDPEGYTKSDCHVAPYRGDNDCFLHGLHGPPCGVSRHHQAPSKFPYCIAANASPDV
ncbi:hypothetical protein V1508DRAFT_67404 [Lipomyces doorenjongii]|uniref:uncharacterized protein n=1 Tax=Lipomyces doorenjongii TaxID=383834 RepID=UPI0034CD42EE